jgi:hypothetical protein
MGIYYNKQSRRQFLIGTGGSLLSLPLLPSLLPRKAWAQASQAPRRLMVFWFDHNNLESMWPGRDRATQPIGDDGARQVLLRSLGPVSQHSPALSHRTYQSLQNSNLLTYLRGLDIRHGAGHGNGGMAAAQDRRSDGGFPTIDTVIERSSSVYPSGTPQAVTKAIRIHMGNGGEFYSQVPGTRNLNELASYGRRDLDDFYRQVFGSLTQGTVPSRDLTNELKTNILNRVNESFKRFYNGTKISAIDKARLEQHMDYLSDLQRNIANTPTQQVISCDQPANPGDLQYDDDPVLYNRTYIELLSVAFTCGLTKMGCMKFEAHDPRWIPGLNASRNVHDIMHGNAGADTQVRVKTRFWQFYSDLIADRFLTPLTAEEGDTGRSYIDNMVTVLMCQGGFARPGSDGGHGGSNSQNILIGSMGGRMRSGHYVSLPISRNRNGREGYLPYNCFLITMLELMGVPRSEYAATTPDNRGYGFYGKFNEDRYDGLRNRFYEPITEIMA